MISQFIRRKPLLASILTVTKLKSLSTCNIPIYNSIPGLTHHLNYYSTGQDIPEIPKSTIPSNKHESTNHQAFQNTDGSSSEDSHSSDSDEGLNIEQIRNEVLNAALQFVPSHGWSTVAISNGAASLGYSSMAHGIFNDGGVELVNHYNKSCNEKLEQILKTWVLEQEKDHKMKIGTTKFIKAAILERLLMNHEYINTWPQAMALNVAPSNASNALFNAGTLVDHIWYYAGDRSHDFNWYTKRGVVALVYKSTELCMVQDKSIDYKETIEFLDRRLADVQSAAKCLKDVDNYTKDIGQLAQAGVLTALNILGMNQKSR